MTTVVPVNENPTMDKEPDNYGMSTNSSAVPPVPMTSPPGQALPGQPQPIVWMPAPVVCILPYHHNFCRRLKV